ncbi:DUF6227 family protein [Streptomyces armeniacus]|uniref:DUF6227 family protein n=1 Tax=Streptomyces armeniacus TaxID=83291 RepID=UPI001C9B2491|nr:DUF6227 family protein [Streptomyces armeniacus]
MGETLDATPGRHLEMLLARAQNPFDVSDRALRRLADAVLCQVELQGWHHRNDPPPTLRCSSYRHAFLLADGSSVSLWELRHDTDAGDGRPSYEIYESETSLRRSQDRVRQRLGGATGTGTGTDEAYPEDGFGTGDAYGAGDAYGTGDAYGIGFDPPGRDPDPDPDGGLDRLGDADPPGGPDGPGRGFFEFLSLTGETARRRAYRQRNSPDHARRLLRRAENDDRPGEDTLRLLSTARGHEIVHVPKPHSSVPPYHVWCSVYEHAFLLADGTEISLYELEHNLTGTGRLVCEVYLEEAVADQAAQRRARDRGLEL